MVKAKLAPGGVARRNREDAKRRGLEHVGRWASVLKRAGVVETLQTTCRISWRLYGGSDAMAVYELGVEYWAPKWAIAVARLGFRHAASGDPNVSAQQRIGWIRSIASGSPNQRVEAIAQAAAHAPDEKWAEEIAGALGAAREQLALAEMGAAS